MKNEILNVVNNSTGNDDINYLKMYINKIIENASFQIQQQ